MPNPSLPEFGSMETYQATAVAVDRDKNSQLALKWAVENLPAKQSPIFIVHVRTKHHNGPFHSGFSLTDTTQSAHDQQEAETAQLLMPFRGFCARKHVAYKEIIIDDTDVSRALIEFINNAYIGTIVFGATSRNAIARRFKPPDVPTVMQKGVPDFCNLYVISKGKVQVTKPAPKPLPTRVDKPMIPRYPEPLDHEASTRSPYQGRWRSTGQLDQLVSGARAGRPLPAPPRRPPSGFEDSLDMAYIAPLNLPAAPRASTSDDFDFTFVGGPIDGKLNHGSRSVDFGDFDPSSVAQDDSPIKGSSHSPNDMHTEMMRLRLELKQTIDLYSTACKEAISAKQKAKEFHQWKVEEQRRIEESKMAEEAALRMAELEKARAKAAIEAAEAAKRYAEMEAQKRVNAEMKAQKEEEEKRKALESLQAQTDVRYRRYSIEEIESATEDFAESLKIGEGGYGPVYKATLHHTPVAIKVLRPDAAQGRKQFNQEVEVLSCIRHPNMVLLLGACPEYGCLVYEYMDNGSLDDRLFRRGGSPPLSWQLRFKIAAEITTALLFLHQAKPEPLVHRDLKPANILIDRNYVSKISDVGLARLVPASVADTVTQYRMTSTAGTFCYIDPEYQQTGMLGIKSDIYSLGVLLLQIVTAKPPMGLTHHVERAMQQGTFHEMLDKTVPDWPVEEAFSFAKMALRCAELKRKDRPDLATVVLPELNRLRNLGLDSASSSSSSKGSGQRSIYNSP